ncbi:MAG: DUF3040 domain-containing protein [Actinomycetota bacterium]|nr:DUF3040 domain-containing protein [Actinomycetota bacterium]
MSTRDDATLSAEEKAAFARIEAQAIADDPALGTSLWFHVKQRLRPAVRSVVHRTQRSWTGPLLVVVGVGLVVVGLATTVAVSVLGLVVVVMGSVPVADHVRRRLELAGAQAAAARRAATPPIEPTS